MAGVRRSRWLLLLASATILVDSACGRSLRADPDPAAVSPATRLGAYRPGMDLRQTFDSLSPTAHPAQLELVTENVQAWVSRWRAVAGARASIDIDSFIFSQDVFGLALLGHLAAKARQGVRVRLQLDAQGMRMSQRPYGLDCMAFLAATANASVRLHRPMARRIIEALVHLEPTLAIASDHDKVVVVDERVSVVGGRNIETKYFAHPDDLPEAFHDIDLVIEGAAPARALTEVFETTYEGDNVTQLRADSPSDGARCAAACAVAYRSMERWLHGSPLGSEARTPIDGQDSSWQSELERFPRLRGAALQPSQGKKIEGETRVLDSVPRAGSDADAVTRALDRLFEAATQQVVMETPYLVLTEPAAAMLEGAGRRAVEMTLLTNSPRSSDNALSQLYFREQWPRLLAAVPQLHLFAAGTTHNVHSKAVVFDEQVVILGSYNLDPFSMLISGEVMVAVWSQELAKQIASGTRSMISRGPPEVYEYTIERDADGNPQRTDSGDVDIAFGPADHTQAANEPLHGLRWVMLRAVPWLSRLPPFF